MTQVLGQAPWLAALAALAVGAPTYVLLYPRLLLRFARAENQVSLERAVNEVECRAAKLRRLDELGLPSTEIPGPQQAGLTERPP